MAEVKDHLAGVLRRIARLGLTISGVLLVTGLVLTWFGPDPVARVFLLTGIGVLIALPGVNVAAELIEEIRRREWLYLLATVAVLGILIFNVIRAF